MGLYETLREMKVALVEDDALLRDSMLFYFRSKGCALSGYADAEAAIAAFETEPPDAVISDHFMPGADGLTLLRLVGERHPAAIRILITGNPRPEITREVERTGIDAFLLKPFSVLELESALRRLLEARRRGRPVHSR